MNLVDMEFDETNKLSRTYRSDNQKEKFSTVERGSGASTEILLIDLTVAHNARLRRC